jgi:hypothetical protein
MPEQTLACMIRFCLAALSWLSLAIFLLGHIWAGAIVAGCLAVYLTFEAVRRLPHETGTTLEERSTTPATPLRRLLQELDNPDPLKHVVGFLIITALMLVLSFDQGFYESAWFLVPALLVQLFWIGILIARRGRAK